MRPSHKLEIIGGRRLWRPQPSQQIGGGCPVFDGAAPTALQFDPLAPTAQFCKGRDRLRQSRHPFAGEAGIEPLAGVVAAISQSGSARTLPRPSVVRSRRSSCRRTSSPSAVNRTSNSTPAAAQLARRPGATRQAYSPGRSPAAPRWPITGGRSGGAREATGLLGSLIGDAPPRNVLAPDRTARRGRLSPPRRRTRPLPALACAPARRVCCRDSSPVCWST